MNILNIKEFELRKNVNSMTLATEKCPSPAKSLPEKIWQREYWDCFIRDEKHYHSALKYIWDNPFKAGLVNSGEHWPHLV